MQVPSTPVHAASATAVIAEPTACDYRKGSCLPFLRALDKYLSLQYPDLHTYVHKRYLLHLQSGKRAIETSAVLADLVEPDLAPPGLATPRRRRAAVPATPDPAPPPGTPLGTLSAEQGAQYKILPAYIEDAESRLAAIIYRYISSEAGRDELRAAHGTRGTAILQALELRGTPDATTFEGHHYQVILKFA